jgi:hypothetical protein
MPPCVDTAFHENVTTCVVDNCAPYKQGAYAGVVVIECPEETFPAANVISRRMVDPQECEGVDNSTIVCNIGTSGGKGRSGKNGAVVVKLLPSWISGWTALLLVVMASMSGLL